MNYTNQLENLGNVQKSLTNTELATRQALNHLVIRLLDDLKAKIETIGLSLFWEEEFSNQFGVLTTEIEMVVTVMDDYLNVASFMFEPRDASSIATFIKTFEETMASILKAKSMSTKLTNILPEKEETLPKRKPKI